MRGFGQLEFGGASCEMARLRCQNMGLELVSCGPSATPGDPMNSVAAICREKGAPTAADTTRAIVGVVTSATVLGLVGYAFRGRKGAWQGAAVGAVIGWIGSGL